MKSSLMWGLKTDEKIEGLTWWWWWWIFFIYNKDDPRRSKQLMILWSTKNCNKIKVNDFNWRPQSGIQQQPGLLKFNGMTAVWYYDGKKMHEPFALEPSDFSISWKGEYGELVPHTGNKYIFKGNPEKYNVQIEKDGYEFDFKITPWNDFMKKQRYNQNHYLKKYGYNILKIYGSKLKGTMREPDSGKESISGSAYFQKVMVNAPSPPWYWGVLHIEDGSYIDYFKPHIGPPMFRRTDSPRSIWDWGELALNRGLQYYIKEREQRIMFKKVSIIKKFTSDNLPIFTVSGRLDKTFLEFSLRAYSRAYWRFEQPWWGRFTSILYYNEFPVILEKFQFKDENGKINLDDLGYVTGNSEHSWGILMW